MECVELDSYRTFIFGSLAFQWPWRPSQQRVLDAIDEHLKDKKLHVVAAPGAGKTILGLELFRRLHEPALVLSPSRAIRDQWIERLRDFLPQSQDWPVAWASIDLSQPGLLTSITYQAMHSHYRDAIENGGDDEPTGEVPDASEIRQLIERLRDAGIKTLILDEAHHLRSEWWKALTHVVEAIPQIHLVSLTATPPYDVNSYEWNKYHELCGTIDEEITAPELVKAGTLCPHQDFIWTTEPRQDDDDVLVAYDRAVELLVSRLNNDETFKAILTGHPYLNGKKLDVLKIQDRPEVVIAMLVFLKHHQQAIPRSLMRALAIRKHELPALERRWWQVLVKSYLFENHWPDTDAVKHHRRALAAWLRKHKLLRGRELRLDESRLVKAQLSHSASKLEACVEIHRHERRLRQAGLRQVFLTDYIRDEDMLQDIATGPAVLGVWPLFRALTGSVDATSSADMAMLTGRVCLLHESRIESLRDILGATAFSLEPLPSVYGFYQLKGNSAGLVTGMTRLLMAGELRVLVGTRSLLGEGWDAPCVNSIVLASFVGSYVLSNQMRGRAIRIDKQDPHKVASIWHLVTISKRSPVGISDLIELNRRFSTFVGLSEQDGVIENGLQRMQLPYMQGDEFYFRQFNAGKSNRQMLARLQQLPSLPGRWQVAIDMGHQGRVVPTLRLKRLPSVRGYHVKNSMAMILAEAGLGFAAIMGNGALGGIQHAIGNQNAASFLIYLVIALGAAALWVLPKMLRALYITVKHLPRHGSLKQMAIAIRDALCEVGELKRPPRQLPIYVARNLDGSADISLGNASFYEQSLFADCMDEVLGVIANPRYLLTRTRVAQWRRDYHAVPRVFGSHKQRAEVLHRHWLQYVGPSALIYTRGEGGRERLLQARARAYSTVVADKSERMDRWQ